MWGTRNRRDSLSHSEKWLHFACSGDIRFINVLIVVRREGPSGYHKSKSVSCISISTCWKRQQCCEVSHDNEKNTETTWNISSFSQHCTDHQPCDKLSTGNQTNWIFNLHIDPWLSVHYILRQGRCWWCHQQFQVCLKCKQFHMAWSAVAVVLVFGLNHTVFFSEGKHEPLYMPNLSPHLVYFFIFLPSLITINSICGFWTNQLSSHLHEDQLIENATQHLVSSTLSAAVVYVRHWELKANIFWYVMVSHEHLHRPPRWSSFLLASSCVATCQPCLPASLWGDEAAHESARCSRKEWLQWKPSFLL